MGERISSCRTFSDQIDCHHFMLVDEISDEFDLGDHTTDTNTLIKVPLSFSHKKKQTDSESYQIYFHLFTTPAFLICGMFMILEYVIWIR